MPTLVEQIAATDAKLDALIASAAPAPSTKEVSLADALTMINAELAKKDTVTKERAAYLRSVLAEITKALSFEDGGTTPSLTIQVIEDPNKVSPATVTADIRTIGNGLPNVSNLETNRTTVDPVTAGALPAVTNFSSTPIYKAQMIQKLLLAGPAEIRKSKASDKLDEVKSMFSITDEDLKGEGYDLRWKIGDLLSLLVNAVKLERLVGGGSDSTEKAETEKAGPWPRDMASAKFDEKAGVFKNDPGAWEKRA